MTRESPFAAVAELVAGFRPPDAAAQAAVLARLEGLASGLGRLADLGAWLAGWRGGTTRIARPVFALYVSAFAREAEPGSAADPVTLEERASARARARLEHLAAGGGAISSVARALGAGVEVFDLGLARPFPHPGGRATMSARECAATMAFGMEALAKSPDLLILADATPDGAVPARAVLGKLEHASGEPFVVLREVGGRGIAAIVGALVAARTQSTPVLIDGAGALAAAAVLQAMQPDALEHVRLGHPAPEAWAREAAQRLGLEPLVELGIAAGEGVGAGAAAALVKLAGELASS